jgi:probable phosphoglycerate mutase
MSKTYPDLMIMRHGETEWNREGRMQGALDSDLTPLGRQQAAAQRAILKRVGIDGWRVLSSPQGRALQTAQIAVAGLGEIKIDDRLAEITVGTWSGCLRQDCLAELPSDAVVEDTPDGALALYEYAPDGEGFVALRIRARSLLDSLTEPTVLVTHGITSRMLRSVVLGQPTEKLGKFTSSQGVVYCLSDGVQTKLE